MTCHFATSEPVASDHHTRLLCKVNQRICGWIFGASDAVIEMGSRRSGWLDRLLCKQESSGNE